ncbi:hypothetical protein [Hymenobacter terrestris]|uniref:Lipocalin-like domain-containing protein n=1 Tax=Hymenobacter terrestris TaxID=2748310 RepID=A0ABX2Q8G8_9BACT|nr:hypothetical protein [Hymenobacter terrestris]NVO86266.1 hypothetical protein [Hymenobacter terrestris]
MRLPLYLSAALLLLSAGCEKDDEPMPDYVFGRAWYNTYQAGEDGATVFSPTNPNLAWRYDGFRLNADGSFLEYGLDALDKPEERPGTWQSEGSQTYRITFRTTTRKGYLLRITKPAKDQLQARRDY